VYADTTFSDLFDWGEVALGALPAQSSQTYEFTAFLNPAVGNAYQQAELRFDLLIGFSGGEMVNDTTISRGGGAGMQEVRTAIIESEYTFLPSWVRIETLS